MPRVIEDSDEEEVHLAVDDLDVSATLEHVALVKNTAKPSPEGPAQGQIMSTSSTEILRREIQNAHEALVQPTPRNKHSLSDELDPSAIISPTTKRLKRNQTAGADISLKNLSRSPQWRRTTTGATVGVRSVEAHETCRRSFDSTGSAKKNSTKSAELTADFNAYATETNAWEVPQSCPGDHSNLLSTELRKTNCHRQQFSNNTNTRLSKYPTRTTVEDHAPENNDGTSNSNTISHAEYVSTLNHALQVVVPGSSARKKLRRRATVHRSLEDFKQHSHDDLSSPVTKQASSGRRRSVAAIDSAFSTDGGPPVLFHEKLRSPSRMGFSNLSQQFLASPVRDDFMIHDPVSMFPNDSDTVPDSTISQRRRLKDALAESENLVLDHLTTHSMFQEQPSFSISSSAFVNGHEASRTDSARKSLSDNADLAMSSGLGMTSTTSVSVNLANLRGPPSGLPSANVTGSPVTNGDLHEKGPGLALEPNTLAGKAIALLGGTGMTQVKKERQKSSTSKARGNGGADELNSDELAIGLPKENYKPRPSRSRSTLAPVEEPVDLSLAPAKATRAKRRKTVHATEGMTECSKSEGLDLITGMGFRSSQASRALNKAHGKVEDAVEALLKNVGAEPAKTGHKAPPTEKLSQTPESITVQPVSGPQRDLVAKAVEIRLDTAPCAKPNMTSDTESKALNVAQPNAASLGDANAPEADQERMLDEEALPQQPTKTKRKKSARTEEDHDHAGLSADIHVEEAAPPKRGRGRPRKATQVQEQQVAAPVARTADGVALSRTHEDIGSTQQAQPVGLQQVDATFRTEHPAPVATPLQHASELPKLPPEQAESEPLRTPQKSSKGKGPTLHSPIDKGKVPHRVGLSKRARIAPLLRVMKK